ncbi:MAG: peptide chain release factor N(5)-glutamine methyltransferase [Actinomycetota bacterium]|nr:peptide chain release factor N(5)-glutamine methyltransferase [Actinomycetota bacterium]
MSGAGTVHDALAAAVDALAAAGCDTPQLDAEVLIADALGVDRGELVTGSVSEVPSASARVIGERVRRRVMREPVAYIIGRKGFRHIDLAVDSRVLIPRPETELLVEVALAAPRGARVHEVGTGSGAVALALMHERPDLRLSASDLSPRAIDVARANARALGLDLPLVVARGLPDPIATAPQGYAGPMRAYDLVLANLPYVSIGEAATLAPEIRRHEPPEALISGPEGLDAIRDLVSEIPAGTRVALEHSPHQAEAVRGLLDRAETHRDLAGRERVTAGTGR